MLKRFVFKDPIADQRSCHTTVLANNDLLRNKPARGKEKANREGMSLSRTFTGTSCDLQTK